VLRDCVHCLLLDAFVVVVVVVVVVIVVIVVIIIIIIIIIVVVVVVVVVVVIVVVVIVALLFVQHGATPLMVACGLGSGLVVDALLHHGAGLQHADHDGNTALHHASGAPGRSTLLSTLVEHGASVRATNKLGETALDVAQRVGDEAMVKVLDGAAATAAAAPRSHK
jgi:ankyrin repeat protein